MTTMTDKKWAKLGPEYAAYCQNCDWQGHHDDLDPIKDIEERTEEGDTVWAGDCPECGAMCFTGAEIARQNKDAATRKVARDLIYWAHVIVQRLEDADGVLSETERTEIALAKDVIVKARAALEEE